MAPAQLPQIPLPENMTKAQEEEAKRKMAELDALFKALDKTMQQRYQESRVRTQERIANLDINEEHVNELWKDVQDNTKKLKERGMMGYDSWAAIMSQILVACLKLNEAIASLKLTEKGLASLKSWMDERTHSNNLQKVHKHKDNLDELKKLAKEHGVNPEPSDQQLEEQQSPSPKP
ncbi:hypothetical protein [Legionella yabuuchiae]|uniref:hypothetical protein n=1 Tax=Legionella yabuuchiae TaxID=376727 RepID=UPI0010555D1C|nr:hypothetical protein [Legionella yabuuchiae]